MKLKSPILKLALFATGLSGIVAEYMLATLATYFLGDSVLQWTMIVSVMLFSMGLGSRLSQYIKSNTLVAFVYIELVLSVLVGYASMLAYLSSGYTEYTGIIIYALSIAIGLLIGLEIPLVVRMNEAFEDLRVNVASVMEKDYWGSLVGGVFFIFVGLPFLGLTYTPFLLGSINFLVAVALFFTVHKAVTKGKSRLIGSTVVVALLLGVGTAVASPVVLYGEQQRYKDKVIYAEQSEYQRIVLTEWKNEHWLFINGSQQLSTLDEDKYHEPLVHPAMQLAQAPKNVLVLGGGDGCAVREILKYPGVESIALVDLDPAMTNLGQTHPILTELNENALNHEKVTVHNSDGYTFMEQEASFYDAIFIDLPDPKSVDLNRLYTYEFYRLCHKRLRPNGVLVTQAGSPYYATQAFRCIDTTMAAAGFATAPMHNQVLTLGEWGWILGSKNTTPTVLKQRLQSLTFDNISTRWINNEAMQLVTSFGKDVYFRTDDPLEVNRVHDPVLYQYYLKGNWDLY